MKSRKQSCYRENVPPSDKNIIPDSFPFQSSARKPSPNVGTGLKSPFPPRPNLPNPLKKKLMSDSHHDTDVSGSSSTAVKDELIRIKSTGNQVDPSAGYSTGWNARRSLNVSKYSLHHPLILPHVDDDGDEEMEIVDETEQATVPSNEDNKSTTPIEIKDSAGSDINFKKDVGVQVHLQGNEIEEQKPVMFLCRNCKCTSSQDGNDGQNLQLVPVDDKPDKPKQLVPKAVEKVLTGAIRREMASEELCTRQDSEINQLNHLLQQYKHERECNRNAESKFINGLATEISTLKEEREKERLHYRDEYKRLQAQLRDTAEAVQAAGELLVRLKEAEKAAAAAEARAREAEQEKENAYKVIDSLKRKQENVASHPLYDMAMYNDDKEPNTIIEDPQWRNEFENFYGGNERELTNLPVPSWWSSGYDTCNI